MRVNGVSGLEVPSSDELNAAFEKDYTVSFALNMPEAPAGLPMVLFHKGNIDADR
jgi:hypothetical protein